MTVDEIIKIVSSFNENKSTGADNIGPKLVKLVINEIVEPLRYIYNLSFSTGIVPSNLKISKVIPVYKKGEKIVLEITDLYHYSDF